MVTISVLAGGPSAEHDVSLQTASEMLGELRRGGHTVRPVRVGRDGTWQLGAPGDDFDSLATTDSASADNALARLKYWGDIALLGLHGAFGEDGRLQGLLEKAGIPFTGSGSHASRVGMDKELSKIAATKLGARCARHELIRSEKVPINRLLKVVGIPCVAKPLCGGSSLGVTRVNSESELEPAVLRARAEDPEDCVLLEEWLDGIEVSCAALRIAGQLQTLPIVAIRTAEGRFYDYEAKYHSDDTELQCPAHLQEEATREIHRVTASLYASLELRGVARMDFIVRADNGQAVFLEMNTLPGFTAHSLVPLAAEAAGLSRLEVLEAILADAEGSG